MKPRIQEFFKHQIDDYSTVSDLVVMKNRELHAEMLECLPHAADRYITVLDLGIGTGESVTPILERREDVRVVGVDFSQKMLDIANRNLNRFHGRYELECCDLTLLDEVFPEQSVDVIQSSITIHNLPDTEKEAVFEDVFKLLKPGGVFINGDFIDFESKLMTRLTREIYLDFLRGSLTGSERDAWIAHALDDDPMNLNEHSKALGRIGFSDFSLKWLFANEAVYCARKSARTKRK